MKIDRSIELYNKALTYIPGGVNSPVRAFKAVGGNPLFIKEAKGSKIVDVDGNEYIDYVGSFGPAIVGHAHPEVVASVTEVAQKGLSFGAPTERETDLAQLICSAFPSMDQIRFVSSGTEACMSAIRLARAYTKREKIIKFTGNYHGHADMLLAKAGSGVATFGLPDSAGVLKGAVEKTLTAPYNDLSAVTALCREHHNNIAAIILEPIVGNAGFIRPDENFLHGLRELCYEIKALLIFDEVMTGFRVAWGGYQNVVAIEPDLTTLGKVIGGGLPLAAYGGRAEIMSLVAPLGPMYQAGTLSGNPLAVTAGLKTLEILNRSGSYKYLNEITHMFVSKLGEVAAKNDIPLQIDGFCGMFGAFFSESAVKNFEDAQKSNTLLFQQYFQHMLTRGIYLAPSAFEAGFVSLAHTKTDIETTIGHADEVFRNLQLRGREKW